MRLRRTRQNGKFCERGFGRYNVDTLPLDLEEQRQFLEQELQLLQRQQEATRIRLERLKEVSTNQR
jgi:vacuolar-type H+-ATPase subunit I/STV1